MSLLLKNHWLVEVTYLLIRFNKIDFFLWNTNNSDRYSVNTQNKHQHSLRERQDYKVLVIMKIIDRVPLPSFKKTTLFYQPSLFMSIIWTTTFSGKFWKFNLPPPTVKFFFWMIVIIIIQSFELHQSLNTWKNITRVLFTLLIALLTKHTKSFTSLKTGGI